MDLDFSHHASPKKTKSNPVYSVSGSGGMSGEVGLKVGPEIVCFGNEKLIEAYGKCGFNGSVDIEGEFSSSNSKPAISKSGDLDLEGSLGIEAPVIDKLHSLFYPKVKWKTDSASISLFSIPLLKSPPSDASSDVPSNDNSSTDAIEHTVNNQSNSDFGEGFGGLIALLFILGFFWERGKRR